MLVVKEFIAEMSSCIQLFLQVVDLWCWNEPSRMRMDIEGLFV